MTVSIKREKLESERCNLEDFIYQRMQERDMEAGVQDIAILHLGYNIT